MSAKRVKTFIFSLAAMLSLLVSAVSACACSHHQPQAETEKPSCHSESHEQPAAEASASDHTASLGTGCNCFARTPVPAVTAKSEGKKASADKRIAAVSQAAIVSAPDLTAAPKTESPDPTFIPYAGRILTAGPARAPPRL